MIPNTLLTKESIILRSNSFIEAEVDGEMVALDIDKGTCYGLNRVGSRIWALIGTGSAVRDICGQLVKEYRIDDATCERQVLDLLEELRTEGLVRIDDTSVTPSA